jgi:type IV pilus assembly protein PilW
MIELMIGLTLGLIVVVVASTVFIGAQRASRTTEGLNRVQETARNAFELMARELRETGGNPCDNNLTVVNVLRNAQTVPPDWWVDWDRQLEGFDGGMAFEGAAVMTKFVGDLSDLTITAHDPATATFTVNNNPHRARAGDLLMACNYGRGAIFRASAVGANTINHVDSAGAGDNCSKGLGFASPIVCTPTGTTYTFSPGSKIGRLVAVGWYIGNNGRAETGGRSLYRVTRNGAEEIAEAVNDMQIEYLPSGAAAYTNAAGAAAAGGGWPGVVSIRVTLTLRSPQVGVSTSASTRLERPMTFTLSMRNRAP